MKNSFKELEKLELQEVNFNREQIKSGINSDIGIFQFISQIVELYFPKVAELFIGLSGGNSGPLDSDSHPKSKYPDMQ